LHREISDLRETVNTTFGTNKTLKKQVSAFDVRVKELKKSIQDLKAKNKELRQHQAHE
jgi:chaperonin cofactor prefoldin